ncbi:FAD-dependent oxidoreductase [Streptomyces sp. NPDC017940]|uniref:FAD-dependent oxidoreductase n=1 Tax=Streptomyces sp. NPDC017940 TaxID=3365017 RepID=UPI0037BD82F8
MPLDDAAGGVAGDATGGVAGDAASGGPGRVTRSGPPAPASASGAPGEPYDVVVVGAGVVGTAIARELARHPLRTAVVEASDDVGEGTSKANTAILHTGFDAVPGSLEARLVQDGYRRLTAYAAQCGIPVERTGALLVAWDGDQLAALPGLLEKAKRNGYEEAVLLDAAEVAAREPHLGLGALGALDVPGESIICPWTTPLAYVTQAVAAGVDLHLNCRVTGVEPDAGDLHALTTTRGPLRTRHLVNAAGLHADTVDRMLGHDTFTVTPRRGQLIVFDKPARDLVRHILLPVPTALGKGVLVAPTVYGNVLLGPTAEDLDDKQATESTADGLRRLREQGARVLPGLLDEDVTTAYAGLRAATEDDDYRIHARPGQRLVTVGGIRSTGLTASMAIAAHVTDLLADCGLDLGGPPRDLPPLTVPNLGENFPRPYQRADLIAADPEYGTVVCHCERVTRGEIRDALASTVPPASIDGLRRRTRARGGRCQGFYCGAAVRELFEGRGGREGGEGHESGEGRTSGEGRGEPGRREVRGRAERR